MFFVGMADEVDTKDMLARALGENKTVVLPKTYMKTGLLGVFEIRSVDELVPGTLGILEPPENRPVAAESIDFIVVPARGYDRKGNRLGRGKGFYDRFLAQKDLTAVRCGVAFDCQIFPHLAHSQFDEPVDIIVTESEMIRCK
jgi:5-formyltetrahydrofolate cyclo-ligase